MSLSDANCPVVTAALPPLKDCRVIVCNDDGHDSPGITILVNAIQKYTDDVWMIAPATNQSARGRAYSIARDVHVRQLGARRFAVEGTPVDCAIIGLNGLIPGKRPDLVLSGVNQGTNLAEDIAVSGTVGACLEAAEQGVPGIAFSQVGTYKASEGGTWLAAETHLCDLLPRLIETLGPTVPVLNVNFPQLKPADPLRGIKVTPAGRRPGVVSVKKKKSPGNGESIFFYDLLRDDRAAYPDCDIHHALDGYITVTPLVWSLTHHDALKEINLEKP